MTSAPNIAELVKFWAERITRDLSPFCDPGTEVAVSVDRRRISAQWKQRTEDRAAVFSASETGLSVNYDGQVLSYESFFASPIMADLRSIAKMIAQSRQGTLFVPTKARLREGPASPGLVATDLIRRCLNDARVEEATTVVAVTGEAGAGKTSVLQELVRQQADAYVRGKSSTLYLYVNAQGRALARFNEALATELQDLRASLTYHGVSTLVRLGLVVPVIDGFDELLGVGGYDDAFSSLAIFIEELDGHGQIVASARSTYYEQEFVARANRASALGSQVWRQVPVEVLAWDDAEVREFVRSKGAKESLLSERIEELARKVELVFRGQNSPLRRKPLFVARTVDLFLQGISLSGESDLLEQLVDGFIERERAEKLLSKAGVPLLSSEQIRTLLSDVAEEMWNQETRELDRRSAQDLAELALLDAGLESDAKAVVIKRMPDMAFLMPGDRVGSVAFEHETFFSFFLAQQVVTRLMSEQGLPAVFLGRSVLPPDVPAVVCRTGRERFGQALRLDEWLGRLSECATQSSLRSGQVRENAGSIAVALLNGCADMQEAGQGLRLAHLTFPGSVFAGVRIHGCRMEDLEFRRADLSSAMFLGCTGENLRFHEVTVNEGTRLEIEGVDPRTDVYGLRVAEGEDARVIYDPLEIERHLRAIGLTIAGTADDVPTYKVEESVVGLLERFVRAFNRSNPVCTSDDLMRGVFGNQDWSALERVLIDSGVVTVEQRSTSGQRKKFLRRQVLPAQIMAGIRKDVSVPIVVTKLWSALETVFPERPR